MPSEKISQKNVKNIVLTLLSIEHVKLSKVDKCFCNVSYTVSKMVLEVFCSRLSESALHTKCLSSFSP